MKLLTVALALSLAFTAAADQRAAGRIEPAPPAGAIIRFLDQSGTVVRFAPARPDGRFDETVPDETTELSVVADGVEIAREPLSRFTSGVETVLELPALEEQITVTATRRATRLEESPSSIVVIGRNELATNASQTVDDMLRNVPGFTLFRRSGSRTANPTSQGASLRGIGGSGASRALVLDDGIPLNDPFGGWVLWSRVAPGSIDRAEILRGGASELYGSGALAGVINLVRTTSDDLAIDVSYGENGTSQLLARANVRADRWKVSALFDTFDTDGYVQVPDGLRGVVDTEVASRHDAGQLQLSFAPSADRSFFVRLERFDESRDNGTPLQVNATDFVQLAAGGNWLAGGAAISLRTYRIDQDYDQTFTAVTADRATERLTRDQHVPTDARGALSSVALPLLWNRHLVTAGFDFRDVEATSFETVFGGASPLETSAGGRQQTGGVFLHDTISLTSRLTMTTALRYDRWRNFDARRTSGSNVTDLDDRSESATSPRLGVHYRVSDAVAASVSAYRSFRAPTLNELYRSFRVGNALTLANEALEAETLDGLEAGVLWTSRENRSSLRTTLFWMEVDDAVTNVTLTETPSLVTRQRQNVGTSRSRGLEIDGEMRWRRFLSASIGILLVDTEVIEFEANRNLEGNDVAQVPGQQVSGAIRWSDPSRFEASLQTRWISRQYEDDLNQTELDAATIVDLFVGVPLPRNLTAYAAVENLFNEEYEIGRSPIQTTGAPRQARFGLRFRSGS